MDYQVLFNAAFVVCGILGGWVMNRVYVAIDKLDADVRNLPHTYVSKNDFKDAVSDIKTDIRTGFQQVDKTLNTLFERLNEKVDKS